MELTSHQKDLIAQIAVLKEQKNAVILAHNYQRPEVYEVADFIGDSLELCRKAAETDCEIIVFCGVHFMAESAALLNPTRKVLLPALDAGCALADMITAEALRERKKLYPDAAVVCYVNCSADVKAESDVCCTSSNAAEVVRALPNKQILFVPDKNLASYVRNWFRKKRLFRGKGFVRFIIALLWICCYEQKWFIRRQNWLCIRSASHRFWRLRIMLPVRVKWLNIAKNLMQKNLLLLRNADWCRNFSKICRRRNLIQCVICVTT